MSSSAIRSVDWIAHHARSRGGHLALVDLATDRRFTYAELNDRAARLATVMSRHFGVAQGDRVTVVAHNSSNILEVQFACWKLGAVFVPLNWRLTVPELVYIVTDAAPALMIHDAAMAATAAAVAAETGGVARLCWDGTDALDAGVADYEDAIASVGVGESSFPVADNTLDSLLCIMYTSGTTGRPKGAMLTHGQMLWNAVNVTGPYALGEDSVHLVVLPLFHIGGLNCFANPVFHYGGTNIVMRAFDPAETLELLTGSEHGITHFLGVPANYLFMSQDPAFESAEFVSLTAAIGGSPTPTTLLETWAAKGVALQQGYGMTESASMVSGLGREDASRKIGSAGVPAIHVETRVVDEHGNDVEQGAVGELWVRGPNLTPGYWKQPQATAEAFTDGWFHTGDAVREDDEGHLYVVDRWKDMYISGGENVYPAEIEDVIAQLDGVGEVAVIGVPDERWVEVGCAVIVRRAGRILEEAEVVRHCAVRLARFKVPKSVVFVEELPRNATGKVLKRDLRVTYAGS